jgi:hypothetical protein
MLQLGLFMNRDNGCSFNRNLRDDQMRDMLSHFPFLVRLKRINQNHITRHSDFLDTRQDFGKASVAIDSTVAGTRIDVSAVASNAPDSIRFNLESDSIEIDERDWQSEKLLEPRISTVRGITIDLSEDL